CMDRRCARRPAHARPRGVRLSGSFRFGWRSGARLPAESDRAIVGFVSRGAGTMTKQEDHGLTNHEITICLAGGAVLGPVRATWSRETTSDVRELSKDYDAFLQGTKQTRFKYHLHDQDKRISHTLILNFAQVTGIYDRVALKG